ncbi:MAG: site-2 protease family protein [Clostridia bacterium]|nr:site-2 protease family protein [Clostridia bacterium]
MLEAIGSFFSTIWPYVIAFIFFIFLVVIHEFGHFIAAKSLGVRVNEFAIGFGPTLFKKQGKETLYMLKLLPFGGYCAMEGEDEDSDDKKAFCNKAAWRRFLIVVMGAVFNLLFGLIIVGITLAPQPVYPTTTVAEFSESATSNAQNGLMIGDEIVEIEGRSIYTFYDVTYNFTAVDDGKLDMEVIRDGKRVHLKDVTFAIQEIEGYNVINMDFKVNPEYRSVGTFLKQTVNTSISYGRMVVFSLVDMINGRYRVSDISGPVQVTATLGEVAKTGLFDMLPLIALITINLGIFNLLPIPALDGGRLVFILIEMIFRKPVPQKYEKWVHAIGMIFLLTLMAVILVKDVWAFF